MDGLHVSPQMTDMGESLVTMITRDLPLTMCRKMFIQPSEAVEMFPTDGTDSSVVAVSLELVLRLPTLRCEGEITEVTLECRLSLVGLCMCSSFVYQHPARRLEPDPADRAECGPELRLVGFFMSHELISPLGRKDFATDST